MKILLISAVTTLALNGCGPVSPTEEDLKIVMKNSINDPESLEIRNTKTFSHLYIAKGIKRKSQVYCGEFHFKNTTGGYSPWVDFWYELLDGKKFLTVGKVIAITDMQGNGKVLLTENVLDNGAALESLQTGLPVDENELKNSIHCDSSESDAIK